MRHARLAVGALAVAGAAGCLGGDAPPHETPTPTLAAATVQTGDELGTEAVDPCVLLDDAVVSDIIDQPVAAGEPFAFDDGAITFQLCNWLTATEPARVVAVGIAAKGSIAGSATITELFDQQRGTAGDPETVDGLGDAAYADHLGLWVLDGAYIVTVDISGSEAADADELAALAAAILERL